MSGTPQLPTFVRILQERRERQIQTAFPAKVIEWSAATNTAIVEPQHFEVWRDGDDRRVEEIDRPEDAYVYDVPVCFPRFISWTITPGEFGLVICTKYSLDAWRNQRQAVDPGDLRRFTMSGATFHPVLMDETPDAAQQFVALKEDVEDIKEYLDQIKASFNNHFHNAFGGAPIPQNPPNTVPITNTYTVTASSKVKVL